MTVEPAVYMVDGEKRLTTKLYAIFSDHNQIMRKLPLFADKRNSQEAARKIERLVHIRASGDSIPPELSRFIENTTPHIRKRLADWGILDTRHVEASKPLSDHLNEWDAALKAKGGTSRHVTQTVKRVRDVFTGCGFTFTSDITVSRVQTHLSALREGEKPINTQTYIHYRKACRQFCKWMVKARRANDNPLEHWDAPQMVTDPKHARRAFTLAELRDLIDVAYHGTDRAGMTGPERALLYRLAVETALRANELRSLTRASFNLHTNKPTVTVEKIHSKRRRRDTKRLSTDTALLLRDHLANKLPDAKAFNMPCRTEVSRMLKFDLKAAKIKYKDDAEKYADFHSLRHTSGTLLKEAGLHPKLIQSHMRHSTITLTMDRYTHENLNDDDTIVSALPALDWPGNEAAAATGTTGDVPLILPASLPPEVRKDRTDSDSAGQRGKIVSGGGDEGGNAETLRIPTGLPRNQPPTKMTGTFGRSARAAEWAGLENRWPLKRPVGSNPTSSVHMGCDQGRVVAGRDVGD